MVLSKEQYKYRIGDIVKHKATGEEFVIISIESGSMRFTDNAHYKLKSSLKGRIDSTVWQPSYCLYKSYIPVSQALQILFGHRVSEASATTPVREYTKSGPDGD